MCGTIERRYFSIYLCTRSGSIWSVGSSQPVTVACNRMRGCTAKPSIFAVCEMQVECIFAFLMDKSVSSCVVFFFFGFQSTNSIFHCDQTGMSARTGNIRVGNIFLPWYLKRISTAMSLFLFFVCVPLWLSQVIRTTIQISSSHTGREFVCGQLWYG